MGLSNRRAEAKVTVQQVRRGAVRPGRGSVGSLHTSTARFPAEELFPVVDELGIGLVAYSPLARGFLSGAVQPRSAYAEDDIRQWLEWWAPEHWDANTAVVAGLTELAEAKGISLLQLALACILAQRDDIVPIPGSRSPRRVGENLAAADVTFTQEELERIATLGHGVRGKRTTG